MFKLEAWGYRSDWIKINLWTYLLHYQVQLKIIDLCVIYYITLPKAFLGYGLTFTLQKPKLNIKFHFFSFSSWWLKFPQGKLSKHKQRKNLFSWVKIELKCEVKIFLEHTSAMPHQIMETSLDCAASTSFICSFNFSCTALHGKIQHSLC